MIICITDQRNELKEKNKPNEVNLEMISSIGDQ